MKKTPLVKSALVLSMAFVLAACNGGNNDKKNTPPSIPEDKSGLRYDPADYFNKKAEVSTSASLTPWDIYQSATRGIEAIENFLHLTLLEAINDVQMGIATPIPEQTISDETKTKTRYACRNPDGYADFNDRQTPDGIQEYEWNFKNCEVYIKNYDTEKDKDYLHSIVGKYKEYDKYEEIYERDDSDNVTLEKHKKIYYREYDITGYSVNTGNKIALSGRFDEESDSTNMPELNQSTYKRTMTYDKVEALWGQRYNAILEYKFSQERNHIPGEDTETVQNNGTLIVSLLGGRLDVKTTEPVIRDLDTNCYVSGVERVEGDGYLEMRYNQNSGVGNQNVLEVDGSRSVYSESSCL